MLARGNDYAHSFQPFTLAYEQNVKSDREWVFSPHGPKILHVHIYTVNLFFLKSC